jgi:phosphotransferase system  glucose/maltose/N-acetylglucosamine-specific IIC component
LSWQQELELNQSIFKTVMSTNNINLSMKKNNEQKEYVFAIAAIFFAVLFLITLFYFKYSNENSTIDSTQKQQEAISTAKNKH